VDRPTSARTQADVIEAALGMLCQGCSLPAVLAYVWDEAQHAERIVADRMLAAAAKARRRVPGQREP